MTHYMRIVFVILHYITTIDTMDAVESIMNNIDVDDFLIVIVDNASPNNSGIDLKNRYRNTSHICVIENEQNRGYAAGNNVGINYVTENFRFDYLIVMNNDVRLAETCLYQKLNNKKRQKQFDLLGPLIISYDGRCDSNPMPVLFNRKKDIIDYQRRARLKIYLVRLHLFRLIKKIDDLRFVFYRKNLNASFPTEQENVKLHGSFLVFSSTFFLVKKGFNDNTYLYLEEELLYHEMSFLNLKSLFCPDIVVFHKEGSSTAVQYKDTYKRKLVRYSEYLRSTDVILELFNDYNIP